MSDFDFVKDLFGDNALLVAGAEAAKGELAAKAAGYQTTILDRTQGIINYSRLGACALGQDGLTRTVTIVCTADSETAPPNPKSLPKGAKIILIGNSCCAELKKAGIQVEKIKPADARCHVQDIVSRPRLARYKCETPVRARGRGLAASVEPRPSLRGSRCGRG